VSGLQDIEVDGGPRREGSAMRTIFPYFRAVVVKLAIEIASFSKITEVQESQGK